MSRRFQCYARGWALEWDGVADFASILDHATVDLGDVFEIEMKVQSLNLTGTHTLLSKGVGAYQVRTSGDKVQLLKQGTGVIVETPAGALALGNFHHLNIWKDGAAAGIAVDLDDLSVAGTPQTLVDTSTDLYIGRLSSGGDFFRGRMQDLRFWSVVRTEDERLRYWGRPLIPELPTLKGWWPMFEGTGGNSANVAV